MEPMVNELELKNFILLAEPLIVSVFGSPVPSLVQRTLLVIWP